MQPETSIIEQSDEQILNIVRKLRVAYTLKRTLRYATTRNLKAHSESVAEHVFALFYLAQYFLPLEDPHHRLDVEKLYQILLFHDFGEITHGDIPYHQKTKEDEARERHDAKEVFVSLPDHLQKIGYENWYAYEERKSPESRFAHALDKIEPLFELFDPVNEQSIQRVKFTYRDHIEKKHRVTEAYPIMRKFVDVISQDMLHRKIFWEEQ